MSLTHTHLFCSRLFLANVNQAGTTSLAGVTFDLELGDSDWVVQFDDSGDPLFLLPSDSDYSEGDPIPG
jgi:hypothetical protein